jgi:hypothetical protein
VNSPYKGHDPETPPGAEEALRTFSDELEAARLVLKGARDAEVVAKQAWKKAKRQARFSRECPRAGTFDGVRVLKDDVDAWIDDQCADEELNYELSKTARQEASDHHDTLRTQGSLAQTLSKSVADSYRGTGGHKW